MSCDMIICRVTSKMQSVEGAISYGAKRLSIKQLNGKQREVVMSFVEGRICEFTNGLREVNLFPDLAICTRLI